MDGFFGKIVNLVYGFCIFNVEILFLKFPSLCILASEVKTDLDLLLDFCASKLLN